MHAYRRQLQLQQSLRWQIPGTLCLASKSASGAELLPMGFHTDLILNGTALIASLATFVRLRTSPRCFDQNLRFLDCETPSSASPCIQSDKKQLRIIPAKPAVGIARHRTIGLAALRQGTGMPCRSYGNVRRRQQGKNNASVPQTLWGADPRLDMSALRLLRKDRTFRWQTWHIQEPGFRRDEGGFEKAPPMRVAVRGGRMVHVASSIKPVLKDVRRAFFCSAIWSQDVAMFFFSAKESPRVDVLLVGGVGWYHRWWIMGSELRELVRLAAWNRQYVPLKHRCVPDYSHYRYRSARLVSKAVNGELHERQVLKCATLETRQQIWFRCLSHHLAISATSSRLHGAYRLNICTPNKNHTYATFEGHSSTKPTTRSQQPKISPLT